MSVRDSVLEALQECKGNYVSGEKLSGDLGVSRAAVWKAINALRQEGYRINAVTNRGYALMDDNSRIGEDEIRSHLPARYRAGEIYVYDVARSTNLIARSIASGEAPDRIEAENEAGPGGGSARVSGVGSGRGSARDSHSAIVVARQQTAGRGRLGRSFFSPAEGIYLSIIIKPALDISRHTLVTVATAAAVAEAIDEVCGQDEETKIKWVNDIYLKGKKVCGILTEGVSDFESGRIESLVVGIGVNTSVDDFPDELKNVAGAVEGDWSKSRLIAEIVTRVLDHVSEIGSLPSAAGAGNSSDTDCGGAGSYMKTYRDKSILIGEDVNVYRGSYRQDPTKEMEGIPARVRGIDDEGGLIVVWDDGSEEILTTGEVSIRPRSRG